MVFITGETLTKSPFVPSRHLPFFLSNNIPQQSISNTLSPSRLIIDWVLLKPTVGLKNRNISPPDLIFSKNYLCRRKSCLLLSHSGDPFLCSHSPSWMLLHFPCLYFYILLQMPVPINNTLYILSSKQTPHCICSLVHFFLIWAGHFVGSSNWLIFIEVANIVSSTNSLWAFLLPSLSFCPADVITPLTF